MSNPTNAASTEVAFFSFASSLATIEEREARFAEEALDYIALAEEEKGRQKKHLLQHAYQRAIASGVAHFQASVARGDRPRALPLDCAYSVQVALEEAGFEIIRIRTPKV